MKHNRKYSFRSLSRIIYVAGIAVAVVLVMLWLPLGAFVGMSWTGLEDGIPYHNLHAVIAGYPIALIVPIVYAVIFQFRYAYLVVFNAVVVWVLNIITVIMLGICLNNVYGVDRYTDDSYSLEDDWRLIEAIKSNDMSYVNAHIRSGGRLLYYGDRGINPMYVAVHMKRWEIARLLVDAGYDVRIRSPRGTYDAMRSLLRPTAGDNGDRIEFVRWLLVNGLRPQESLRGDSMLMIAVMHDDADALKMMLGYSDIRNGSARLPMQLALHAIKHSSWKCAEMILPYLDSSDMPDVVDAAVNKSINTLSKTPRIGSREQFIAKARSYIEQVRTGRGQ